MLEYGGGVAVDELHSLVVALERRNQEGGARLSGVVEGHASRAEERALLYGARLTAEASGVIPASQSQSSFGFRAGQDGRAWCWGNNEFGELGSGQTGIQPFPMVLQEP